MKYVHFTPGYFLNPTHPITVGVIGCGGTGSHVIKYLAQMNQALKGLDHPGLHVTAYDHDEVSSSNIGSARQTFCFQDESANKAVTLMTRLNRFYGTTWEGTAQRFDSSTGKTFNIIISCVDTASARKEIFNFLNGKTFNFPEYMGPARRSYYWLDFGNSLNTGQFILGTLQPVSQPKSKLKTVAELPHILEMFPDISKMDTPEQQGPTCSAAESLARQDLFINTILALNGVQMLWRMFREARIGYHGMFINLETNRMAQMDIQPSVSRTENRKAA